MKTDKDIERMNRIGFQIKSKRKEIKMSGKRLAEKVGISSKQIFDIESGKSGTNVCTLIRIADALKCQPSYLLCDEKVMDPEESVKSAILRGDTKELIRLYYAHIEMSDLIKDYLMKLAAEQVAAQAKGGSVK